MRIPNLLRWLSKACYGSIRILILTATGSTATINELKTNNWIGVTFMASMAPTLCNPIRHNPTK
jgi:hypothetical protein